MSKNEKNTTYTYHTLACPALKMSYYWTKLLDEECRFSRRGETVPVTVPYLHKNTRKRVVPKTIIIRGLQNVTSTTS